MKIRAVLLDLDGTLADTACQKLRKIITDKDMTVIMIASDLGDEAAPHGLHYIDINIGPRIGRKVFFVGKRCFS